MELFITLLVGLLLGWLAYIVASIVPFTARWANAIGCIVAIIYIIGRLS